MTWMMTIAHRRAVDRIRASQAGRDRDEKIGRRDIGVDFDEVAERAEVSIEHEKVARALGSLSKIQREVVQMAYYGGFSHSELSHQLGVPLGTVKTRLRDGMIKLREELGVSA